MDKIDTIVFSCSKGLGGSLARRARSHRKASEADDGKPQINNVLRMSGDGVSEIV
jgi:hypothetical protein